MKFLRPPGTGNPYDGFRALVEDNDKNSDALEKEALELDKLEASKKTDVPDEAAVSADESTPAPPPQKTTALLKSLTARLIRDKVFVLSLLAGVAAGLLVLWFVPFHRLGSQNPPEQTNATARLVYQFSGEIGARQVTVTVAVPFRDMDERRELISRLARVKQALPRMSRTATLRDAAEKQDNAALRNFFIKVIAEIAGIPVQPEDLRIVLSRDTPEN